MAVAIDNFVVIPQEANNYAITSLSWISLFVSLVVRIIFGFFRTVLIAPVKFAYNSWHYCIFIPVATLVFYLIEIPLMPLNMILVALFDINLIGLVSYNIGDKLTVQTCSNNMYTHHKSSNSELYIKQLKRGYFSQTSNTPWDNGQSKRHLNVIEVLYLVYKFLIISLVFSGVFAVLTSFMLIIVKSLCNQNTMRLMVTQIKGALRYVIDTINDSDGRIEPSDIVDPGVIVDELEKEDVPLEIGDTSNDNEEELIADKYSDLQYLRNLKTQRQKRDFSGTSGVETLTNSVFSKGSIESSITEESELSEDDK